MNTRREGRSRTWRRPSAFALIVLAFAARSARADEAEPVHLAYSAPAGCPGERSVVNEIGARTTRLRLARADEPGRRLEITLERVEDRFAGTLLVTSASGTKTERRVMGETCAVVASAVALVAALTIDPAASIAAVPEPQERRVEGSGAATATSPAAEPPPPATPPPPVTFGPEPSAPPGSPLQPHAESRPGLAATAAEGGNESGHPAPQTPGASGRRSIHLGAGIGAEALGFSASAPASGTGSGPGAVAGPSVQGSLDVDGPRLATTVRLAPELRLGAAFAQSGTFSVGGAPNETAHFAWYRLELAACPLRFEPVRTLAALPCLAGAAGGLSATGQVGSVAPQSQLLPWVELGAQALIAWRFAGPLALEGAFGLAAPLLVPSFFLRQNPQDAMGEQVYRPPPVAALARIGLLVQFL